MVKGALDQARAGKKAGSHLPQGGAVPGDTESWALEEETKGWSHSRGARLAHGPRCTAQLGLSFPILLGGFCLSCRAPGGPSCVPLGCQGLCEAPPGPVWPQTCTPPPQPVTHPETAAVVAFGVWSPDASGWVLLARVLSACSKTAF